jgi:hypothetical protein
MARSRRRSSFLSLKTVQICNRLYRRLVVGRGRPGTARRIKNPRYGTLRMCLAPQPRAWQGRGLQAASPSALSWRSEIPQRHRNCAKRKRRKRRAPFARAATTLNGIPDCRFALFLCGSAPLSQFGFSAAPIRPGPPFARRAATAKIRGFRKFAVDSSARELCHSAHRRKFIPRTRNFAVRRT